MTRDEIKKVYETVMAEHGTSDVTGAVAREAAERIGKIDAEAGRHYAELAREMDRPVDLSDVLASCRMATLRLVRFENGDLALQGEGDRSQNADFSLFDVDGEGGDPFSFGNRTWEIVSGVASADYDTSDSDSFWSAQQAVIDSARAAGIELPDYVE